MAAIKTQTAPALDRALSILELLAQSRTGLTLPELAQQSNLPRSSVHYLLVTLERRGYLRRNERTSRYLFGTQLLSLANDAVVRLSLRQQAAVQLQTLMQRTQLTVHMGILERNEGMIVARHEPPQSKRMATWIGKRMDVHCTGLGKALIAQLPEDAIDEIIRQHGLARHNENTLATPRRLKEDLLKAARLGYALDDEEDELGLRCIGVPIHNSEGETIAAISLAGLAAEITPGRLPYFVREMKRTATLIAECQTNEALELPARAYLT